MIKSGGITFSFKTAVLFLMLFILLLPLSCERYEEGGLLQTAEGNLSNTWELDQYILNDTDRTASLLISDYQEEYTFNGNYFRSYAAENGSSIEDTAFWSMTDDRFDVLFEEADSITGFSTLIPVLFFDEYRIVKLNKRELWYFFETVNMRHELRFKSMVP